MPQQGFYTPGVIGVNAGTVLHHAFDNEIEQDPSESDLVSMYISGERNIEMTEEKAMMFLKSEKKKRHLRKNERRFLHRPGSDGLLSSCNLDISGILPVA